MINIDLLCEVFPLFRDNEKFLRSDIFSSCFENICNSKDENTLKLACEDLVKQVMDKTNIKFDYTRPMIWDNWGLDFRRYLGSGNGGKHKFGYGSDTSFDFHFDGDIDILLEEIISCIYKSKADKKNLEDGTIWKKIFDEDNGKFPGPTFMKFKMNILSKIWLENMEPGDLKKLEIRCKSNYFSKNQFAKEYLVLSESNTFPLMLYAIELIAKHNLNIQPGSSDLAKKDKIYLSDNDKFSEIHVAVSPKSLIKYGVDIKEEDVVIEFDSTIKDLILEFEKFIAIKENLSDKKDILNTKIQDKDIQPEQTRDQKKQFLSELSNEEFFKYIVANSETKKIHKINEK